MGWTSRIGILLWSRYGRELAKLRSSRFIAAGIFVRHGADALCWLRDQRLRRPRFRPGMWNALRISVVGRTQLSHIVGWRLALCVVVDPAAEPVGDPAVDSRCAVGGSELSIHQTLFPLPQAYLGICFGFGIPMAYAASWNMCRRSHGHRWPTCSDHCLRHGLRAGRPRTRS